MIRAIILDDGYYSKDVIVSYGINFKKITLSSFLNSLCDKHYSSYIVKTAHYEDLNTTDSEYFYILNTWSNKKIVSEYCSNFENLWNSEDIVDGIDLY